MARDSQFVLKPLTSNSEASLSSPLQLRAPLNKFTVCFWMKAEPVPRHIFTIEGNDAFRMSTSNSHINLQIGSRQSSLYRSCRHPYKLTGKVVSVCLTWSSRLCKLFINSALVATAKDVPKKFSIQPGSTVYLVGRLGKVPDLISHFNIWSHVLSTQVIAVLGQRCGVERGDVISWHSFKNKDAIVEKDICSKQAPLWNQANLVKHWPLDGPDVNVRLNYSAVYLEGRYSTKRSLFLDSTRAYAALTPGVTLTADFTISFWMNYTSDDDRNATIISNFNEDHKEFIFKILHDKFVFQRRQRNTTEDTMIQFEGDIEKNKWQHVALVWQEDSKTYTVRLYIDGYLINSGQQQPLPVNHWVTASPAKWDLGRTYESWNYGYFLGYLSDFMVFDTALSHIDIASIMAVGSPIYKTVWEPIYPSPSNPLPIQTSRESWPDIGQCTKRREYQPGDCMGALLARKDRVNITTDDSNIAFQSVPCDQVTNGGGWLVIGRRFSNIHDFNQTITKYGKGFWENETQFWLGGNKIVTMTRRRHQLLVEIRAGSSVSRTLCHSFQIESTSIDNNVHMDGCSGFNISIDSLADFKALFINTSYDQVEVKIRPLQDLPNDFVLFFGPSRSPTDNVIVSHLTKLKSFTLCLWTKIRHNHGVGTLFSFVSDNLKCIMDTSVSQLRIACGSIRIVMALNLFDDKWHHICLTWRSSVLKVYVEGKLKSENTSDIPLIFTEGGILNIGRYQNSTNPRFINSAHDFIGQIGHVNLWNFIQDLSAIAVLSKGPGSESGNIVTWSLVRAWVPANVQVLYPSSCTLQATYRWNFKSYHGNASLQFDDEIDAFAQVENGTVESDGTIIFNQRGSIVTQYVEKPSKGISMSFWMKQEVLISSILGDNKMYYDQLKKWLSPIISHHASWVRCYSSKVHGKNISSFHGLCDLKGPTLTLIKVKNSIFGGMIDQSWGGSSGFLPSKVAFLFTLSNPYKLPPTKFDVKNDYKKFAAHTNQFVGPSFGFNDLTIYEHTAGRFACWSSLGLGYDVSTSVTNEFGSTVFTGSQVSFPDDIEVFFYDLPSSKLPDTISNSSKSFSNDSICSSSQAQGQFIQWNFTRLETITHISLEGRPDQGHVTAFLVNYSAFSNRTNWKTVEGEFISRNKWEKMMYSLLPPVQAYGIRIIPTEWHKNICMIVNLFTIEQECSQAFGMENKVITDQQITASSSYNTYKGENHEYRWPHRGRLNYNTGSYAWHPARMTTDSWFQVDLGKPADVRCFALQGRPIRIQFVREFQLAYSLEGNAWDYAETNYGAKTFKGIQDQKSTSITVLPRAFIAKFVRIFPVNCSKYCALRVEFYGNQSGRINDKHVGLKFAFHRGSNSFIFSTSLNTWKVENKPRLKQWTHVTITWSPANGIRVYYNGSLKDQARISKTVYKLNQSDRITLLMDGGVGSTPAKIGQLKVWNQDLDESLVVKDYESIDCDFERDMCLDWFEVSNQQMPLWKRTLYCITTNSTGPCVDDDRSLAGYCMSHKSLPANNSQSATFTSHLLYASVSCISFKYKITGNDTGRINVNLIELNGEKLLLWRQTSSHDNIWNEGHIPINRAYPFKVEFEGMSAAERGGYLLIDNITISVHKCLSLKPVSAASNTSVLKTKMINHIPTYLESIQTIQMDRNIHKTSWTPCYSSRDHGWNVKVFKKLCKSKGPTIALVRSSNTIYGGFTQESWEEELTNSEDLITLQFDGHKDFSTVNLSRDLKSFSISLWMQTSSTSSNMTLLSTTADQLVIQYLTSDEIVITLHGQSHSFVIPNVLNDNHWHHIFIQWQHLSRKLSLYLNGDFIEQTSFTTDNVLQAGTLFALSKKLSNHPAYFEGKLYGVNIWSNEIEEAVALIMAQGCNHGYLGNAITWEDLKNGIKKTTKKASSSCALNTSESDYDLLFSQALPGYVAVSSTWTVDLRQFTMFWWMKTDSEVDHHILSYMNNGCKIKKNFGIRFHWNHTISKWMFVLSFVKNCASDRKYQERFQIHAPINDGYWHHVGVTWNDVNLRVDVTVDGLLEGSITFTNDSMDKYIESIPKSGTVILAQTPENNSSKGDLNSKLIFIGRLTDFNVANKSMSHDALRLLSLRWGSFKGNLLSWKDFRHGVFGNVTYYSPSSCRRGIYRPDPKAFLFALDTNVSTATIKERKYVDTAISLQASRGLVFGESPHDLIIGVNGSMRRAVYSGSISYELLNQLDKGSLAVDDIEVLYMRDSLCFPQCIYPYSCNEIIGRCTCHTADSSFGLCDIEKSHHQVQSFWPLDHPDNIKNLKGKTWGVVKGDVSSVQGVNMGALKTDQGSIVLERFNTSCLDSISSCTLTVSLWLKYWLTDNDQNQTFFEINGLLMLYQPKGNVMEIAASVYSNRSRYISHFFSSTAGIWSHYAIFISKMEGQVYRNGRPVKPNRREFIHLSENSKNNPNNGMITLSPGGALAEYDDVMISLMNSSHVSDIIESYTDKTIISVAFSARFSQELWHDDLLRQDSSLYNDLVNRIESSISSFYSQHSISIHGIMVDIARKDGDKVKGNFTISYYPWSYNHVKMFEDSVSSKSMVNGFALKDLQIYPSLVPNRPLNVEARKFANKTMLIKWDPPVMDTETLSYFQGYKIYYRKGCAGSSSFTVEGEGRQAILNTAIPYEILKIWVTAFTIKGEGLPSNEVVVSGIIVTAPTVVPNITKAYNTSSSSIFVKWFTSGNSTVIGYEISVFRSESQEEPVFVLLSNCTQAALTGLKTYTTYAIKVAAFNQFGPGPCSKTIICTTDEEVPTGSPHNVTLSTVTSREAHLVWEPIPSSQRNGLILGYNITYYLIDYSGPQNSSYTTTKKSSSITLVNLRPYSTYRVHITGYNSKGQGPAGLSFDFKTNETAPSEPPFVNKAASQGSTSIVVEWQSIPEFKLNGILRYYIVHYQVTHTNLTWSKDVKSPPSKRRKRRSNPNIPRHVVLDGLRKFTNYSVKVAGVTVHPGPYSTPLVVRTGQDVPGAVVNLQATNDSSTSINVTWQRPPNPNGIILGYKVNYSDAGGNLRSTDTKLTSVIIKELVNYTSYYIRVSSYTIKGEGNVSMVTCTTDEEVPSGPPRTPTAFALNLTSIEVKWQPVAESQRRGIITKYLVKLKDLDKVVPGDHYRTVFVGLKKQSTYSVKLAAYTRKGQGPFSELIHVSTNTEGPKFAPANVTAQLIDTNKILVQWSNFAQGGFGGYRVTYTGINNPFAVAKNITVDPWNRTVILQNLKYYTRYEIKVSAYTTIEGNASQPVYVRTGESVPTHPPSKGVVVSRNSTSIRVFWDLIPIGHRNGQVIKYRVECRKSGSNQLQSMQETDQLSMILKGLDKNTRYDVKISGATSVGYGNSSFYSLKTDEDVPSETPQNLTAQNWTSLHSLPISWQPVPANHMHGMLTGYILTYTIIKRGDKDVFYSNICEEVSLPPNQTSFTIKGLLPVSVYQISVVALARKGPGPKATTFGETCRCTRTLSTSWSDYYPYVNVTKGIPGQIIPVLIAGMTSYCCGHCKEHGHSMVDFSHDGNGQAARKSSVRKVDALIDGKTDFSFPMYGYEDQCTYKGGFGFSPLILSPGVAYIVRERDTVKLRESMFNAIVGCWPVLAIPIVMCYIAGFIIWVLDSRLNSDHFPKSFIEGIQNGFWWAFVSMTTVGYGDKTPIGHASRLFAVVWTLCGIVILSVCTSTITTSLTKVTVNNKPVLYSSKVAALHESPEFWLGKRKNAKVNEKRRYRSLQELIKALEDREVEGILVDTFAAGSRSDLFSKPHLRIAKVLDYKIAFGVVTAGHAVQLKQCFHDYLMASKADLYHNISNNVRKIEYNEDPPDQIITDGLFNTKAEHFKVSVKYTGCVLLLFLIIGITFDWVRRIRRRVPVEAEGVLYGISRKKQIMQQVIDNFKENMERTSRELTKKHRLQLKKAWEIRNRRLKLNSREVSLKMQRISSKSDDCRTETDHQLTYI